MKKFGILPLIILIYLLYSLPMFSSEWSSDWRGALRESVKLQRPILMDFYTDWCPPCKKLSSITFKDKKVLEYFKKEKFILVKVNPEKDREAEKKFKVFSYPTLLLFNKKGDEIARILGYRSPGEFITEVSNLRRGIGSLSHLLKRYEKEPENYDLISKIVNKYIARAKYPEALGLLDKIKESDGDNRLGRASQSLFRKGYIYYKWKKYKKSIEVLTSIGKIYPASKEAEDGAGAAIEYSLKLKDNRVTIPLIDNFLKIFPKSRYAGEYKKLLKKIKTER